MKARKRREDYKTLENRKFDYEYDDGERIEAKVAGCNRSVGITIVDANDPTIKIVCLNGPATRNYRAKNTDCYNRAFDYAVGMIISGVWKRGFLMGLEKGKDGVDGDGTLVACPYSGE